MAVGAVVQNDVSLLFVRHTYGALPGQWSFPTGFAEPLESPEVTALREVKEEGGIIAAVDGLLTLCTVDWEADIQLYLVWLCQHIQGEPTPDGVEIDSVRSPGFVYTNLGGVPLPVWFQVIAGSQSDFSAMVVVMSVSDAAGAGASGVGGAVSGGGSSGAG